MYNETWGLVNIAVMFYKKNSSLNMKKFSFLLMIMCGYAQAGGDCELTEEYKVEKWEFEKVLRQNLNECLYSISQANYWYAASQCVEKTKHLPIIEGNCLYNAAHKGGEFQRIEITTDICKHYDRDSEFYRRALLEEMQRQKVRKCK
ncbi:MAG: hypothetical protein AB2692_04120 [Candidatus Thiodiazotropha sp.]